MAHRKNTIDPRFRERFQRDLGALADRIESGESPVVAMIYTDPRGAHVFRFIGSDVEKQYAMLSQAMHVLNAIMLEGATGETTGRHADGQDVGEDSADKE